MSAHGSMLAQTTVVGFHWHFFFRKFTLNDDSEHESQFSLKKSLLSVQVGGGSTKYT